MKAPVILFVYKRTEHLKRTLYALNKNKLVNETDLIIYSDGPKRKSDVAQVKEVRNILQLFLKDSLFQKVSINYSESNKGLADSIITGVTEVFKYYSEAIILEDDLITTIDFLDFMNDCLEYYRDDKRIGAISGYTLPIKGLKNYDKDIYVSYTGNSWGWATWKEVWEKVDWDICDYKEFQSNKKDRKNFNNIQYGITNMLDMQMKNKIDSWAVRWDYHFFRNNLLTVYPKISRVSNEGFDETGTHCSSAAKGMFQVHIEETNYQIENVEIKSKIIKETANYSKIRIIKRVLNFIKSVSERIKNIYEKVV